MRVIPGCIHGLVLALSLVPVVASGAVPQSTTFTGRLEDDLGNPLTGPVGLELRVFDQASGGTQLYAEDHPSVPLDPDGRFAVQLGQGTPLAGSFDAALFADPSRWLEVVVDGNVLTPRTAITSVPWALVAERANAVVPDPSAPRFEDCGDGTVADHRTGLRWEQKTGTPGSLIYCTSSFCSDPYDVNNIYIWSADSAGEPDGTVFTNHLLLLNGGDNPHSPLPCLGGRCDWRLPTIQELQTILIGPDAAPDQARVCPTPSCIDPDFAAVGGPTEEYGYWSSSPVGSLVEAWVGLFNYGLVTDLSKNLSASCVRAVRIGDCHD